MSEGEHKHGGFLPNKKAKKRGGKLVKLVKCKGDESLKGTVERGMYNFVFEVFLQSVFDLSEPLRGEAPGPECLGIQLFGFMLALW